MDMTSVSNTPAVNEMNNLAKGNSVQKQPDVILDSSVVSPAMKISDSSMEELTNTTDSINKLLDRSGQSFMFTVDETTKSSVVKIVDKSTDEVIRQLPDDTSLKILKDIQNYLSSMQNGAKGSSEGLTGVLFNEII